MAKSVASLRSELRDKYTVMVKEFFGEAGEDVLITNANELAFPVIDSEGGEHFIVVKLSVPTGSRDDKEPYDGYAVAEAYRMKLAEKAEKAEKSKQEKAKKIERDKLAREKKKAE